MSEVPQPKTWTTVRLDEVAEITGGVTKNAAKTGGSAYPYLRVANVYANCLKLDDVASIRVTSEELQRVLLAKNDLLVVEGNGSIEQIGRVALWDGAINPCVHQNHLIKARCLDQSLPEWVLHYLMSPAGRAAIVRAASSTSGLHTLSLSKVASLSVPIAPTKAREETVEALDSYLTRLDAAAEGLRRVEANLKRYRASVLKAAVEGRLVPTEAELAKREGRTYEPASVLLARILDERRRRWEAAELAKLKAKGQSPKNDTWKSKYQAPTAPDPTNLPPLPEGWCWATVEAVGDVLLGRQRAPQYLTGKYAKPYLRVANVKDDWLDYSDVEEMDFDRCHFEKYRLQPDDILVSEGQSPELVGQSAIYAGGLPNVCFQKTLHRFRPVAGGPSARFAQLVFRAHVKSGVFMRLASITTNIAHLTLEKFQAAPFPLAPLREQERIVEEAGRHLSQADTLCDVVKSNLARLARLRQAILTWAFEGKLVDQDPNDAPASVLLERIRQQRESDVGSAKVPRAPRKKPR